MQLHGNCIALYYLCHANIILNNYQAMATRKFIQFETKEGEKAIWSQLAKQYAEKTGKRGTVSDVVRICAEYGRSKFQSELLGENDVVVLHLTRSQAARVIATHALQRALSELSSDSDSGAGNVGEAA